MLFSVMEFKAKALAGHSRSLSAEAGIEEKKWKAKLGMLIVHGPGQDMLDLLVAANMVTLLKKWETWGSAFVL